MIWRDTNGRTVVRLEVLGTPAPKGSGRAMMRGGKARYIPGGSSSNEKAMLTFEGAIREVVHHDVFGGQRPEKYAPQYPAGVPVSVGILFRLKRPKGHYGTGRNAGVLKPDAPIVPTTKPDVDKLARHVIDVLTGSVWHDDAQVAELSTRKVYAQPGNEGALIIVNQWSPA